MVAFFAAEQVSWSYHSVCKSKIRSWRVKQIIQENLGSDLGFDLGLAAAPAPENGLDGTADFFVNVFKLSKQKKS